MNVADEVLRFVVDKVIVDSIRESKRRGTNIIVVKYSDFIKAIALYINELETRLRLYCDPLTPIDIPSIMTEYLGKRIEILHRAVKEDTCPEFAEMINKRTDAVRAECIKRGLLFKRQYIVIHVLKDECDIDVRKSLLKLLRNTSNTYYKCVARNMKRVIS